MCTINSFICHGRRCFHSGIRSLAKPKVASASTGKSGFKAKGVIPEPTPVRDAKLLVTRCCGLNKYQGQEDPILKPDSEYPDWLWNIHVGKPKPYYKLDPNTKEYWIKLYQQKRYHKNVARKGIRYYHPPRTHELTFSSRLPLTSRDESST